MKKLILLLITLTTLTNVSYASFPITENNAYEVLTSTTIVASEKDIPLIVRIILFLTLVVYPLFLLIRTWIRGFKTKRWVRIFTLALFSVLFLLILLAFSYEGVNSGG